MLRNEIIFITQVVYFKQIIICISNWLMQNWRFSYDAQKSKLTMSNSKGSFCPAFLVKTIPQKKQTPQSTESPFYFKKFTKNNKSALKSLDISKSPNKINDQKCLSTKTPKRKITQKNLSNSPEQNVNMEHKSSIITQDSQYSSLHNLTTLQVQKFRPLGEPQKSPSKNIKQINKQRVKTQISPLKQKLNLSKYSTNPNTNERRTPEKVSERAAKSNIALPDNTTIDDFEFLSQLGRGSNSVVYLARHKKLGMIFAIKLLPKQIIKSQNLEQVIFRQIKIHSFVKNSNVISLYKILYDSKCIYLVMEYTNGGTLYSLTKKQRRMSEQKISKLIRDICRGLKYLHDNNIMHRDLKLQNIMISQGIAKIGDFGCAVYSLCMRKSNIGSPAYLSPEQLNGNYYGKKIDIWSVGILAYQMLFSMTPFDKQIIKALHKGQQNIDMTLKFPIGIQISGQAKDFLTRCLQKKQNSRLSIDEVLNHPFLSYENQLNSTKV